MEDARAEAASAVMRRHARRVRVAAATPANWMELVRYCFVGGSGYLINLGVFLLADRGMPYTLAFTVAFICAATSNFLWNRLWTFRIEHGRPHRQYARFLGVSGVALGLDLVVLRGLVEVAGTAKPTAAAIAILVALPVSFLGNKLWTFR
jgi:dolichol-phosphate mannosyltransferase